MHIRESFKSTLLCTNTHTVIQVLYTDELSWCRHRQSTSRFRLAIHRDQCGSVVHLIGANLEVMEASHHLEASCGHYRTSMTMAAVAFSSRWYDRSYCTDAVHSTHNTHTPHWVSKVHLWCGPASHVLILHVWWGAYRGVVKRGIKGE